MSLKLNVFMISVCMLFMSARLYFFFKSAMIMKNALIESPDLRCCYKSSSHSNGYVSDITVNCISVSKLTTV